MIFAARRPSPAPPCRGTPGSLPRLWPAAFIPGICYSVGMGRIWYRAGYSGLAAPDVVVRSIHWSFYFVSFKSGSYFKIYIEWVRRSVVPGTCLPEAWSRTLRRWRAGSGSSPPTPGIPPFSPTRTQVGCGTICTAIMKKLLKREVIGDSMPNHQLSACMLTRWLIRYLDFVGHGSGNRICHLTMLTFEIEVSLARKWVM